MSTFVAIIIIVTLTDSTTLIPSTTQYFKNPGGKHKCTSIDCYVECKEPSWNCQSLKINATKAETLTVSCKAETCFGIEIYCPLDGSCNIICKEYMYKNKYLRYGCVQSDFDYDGGVY